jgi:GH24 family phage-related lysozyme (muramidase)
MSTLPSTPSYHLSKRGYDDLTKTEANIPFIYDDKHSGPVSPLNSYAEARGTPTIGVGVAIQTEAARQQFEQYLGTRVPPDVLEQINRAKITEFEAKLNQKLTGVNLSQAMYDALFSLMWNAGPGNGALNRAIDAIRRGDYAAAQQEIANGPVTSKGELMEGLVRRRAAEARRFAEEGLSDFQGMASEAAEVVKRNPIPFLMSVAVVAGTAFFLVRKLVRG